MRTAAALLAIAVAPWLRPAAAQLARISNARYEYRVLATSKTSTMQKEPAPVHRLRHPPVVPGRVSQSSLDWRPDGRYLVAGSTAAGPTRARIQIWEVTTGELPVTLMGHAGVNAVRWRPDGAYLASGGDYTVRLWGEPINTSR